MIDPLISLAFSVYSNKGGYALLLGSGISHASGIPTGWEMTLNLIRRVAKLEGSDCGPDPANWYSTKYGGVPDYSKLLDEIAKTPADRQQLLRGYFEPTADERSQGLKLPSAAHKAIAKLVASGYVRVIMTTNFDRLTEKALSDVGVSPAAISTPDQLKGASPLTHSSATLIKLHGDYLDTRIKNTDSELSTYDPEMDKLIDRILDEYGLIVCGWSGEWDAALRNAIARCPARRFTTYWATKSELTAKAQELANCRQAVILRIQDANHFFETLLEKVQSLEDVTSPHPLSTKIVVATVKRHLMDPLAIIRFNDFVREEAESLIRTVLKENIPDQLSLELASKVISTFDQVSESLLSVFITSAYWGEDKHVSVLVSCLERLANLRSLDNQKSPTHIRHRQYPALLMLYGAGISAVASGKFQTLLSILTKPLVRGYFGRDEPFCASMHPDMVIENGFGFPQKGFPYFVSTYLKLRLREPFFEYIANDSNYKTSFDRFEYLWSLIVVHRLGLDNAYCSPLGWATRGNFRSQDNCIMRIVDAELKAEGKDWGPLLAGWFNGSLETAKNVKDQLDGYVKKQFNIM